jgi:hypothetical protein
MRIALLLALLLAPTPDIENCTNPASIGSAGTVAPCGPIPPLLGCPKLPIVGQGQDLILHLVASDPGKPAFLIATPWPATPHRFLGCDVFLEPGSVILWRGLTSAIGLDTWSYRPWRSTLCSSQWVVQGLVFSAPRLPSTSNVLLLTFGA